MATPQVVAAARIDVANALTPTLHAALVEFAGDNYTMARTRYNDAGGALVAALAEVDPDAAPECLVEQPERLRPGVGCLPWSQTSKPRWST